MRKEVLKKVTNDNQGERVLKILNDSIALLDRVSTDISAETYNDNQADLHKLHIKAILRYSISEACTNDDMTEEDMKILYMLEDLIDRAIESSFTLGKKRKMRNKP